MATSRTMPYWHPVRDMDRHVNGYVNRRLRLRRYHRWPRCYGLVRLVPIDDRCEASSRINNDRVLIRYLNADVDFVHVVYSICGVDRG